MLYLFIISAIAAVVILGFLVIRQNHFNKDDLKKINTNTQNKTEAKAESKKYRLKKHLMTKNELYFYEILTKNFNSSFIIQPQVALSSIIEKNKTFEKEYQNELYRIVDFVIFDKRNFSPLLIVEINDETHYIQKRQERDKKIEQICNQAGINIMKFWTKYENKEEYVVNRISNELHQH